MKIQRNLCAVVFLLLLITERTKINKCHLMNKTNVGNSQYKYIHSITLLSCLCHEKFAIIKFTFISMITSRTIPTNIFSDKCEQLSLDCCPSESTIVQLDVEQLAASLCITSTTLEAHICNRFCVFFKIPTMIMSHICLY